MIVSYAQNAEDVVLLRAFGDQPNGFYIDVGAADPRADSVTKVFYERGWTGINIEPQLEHHRALVAERQRDVNLRIGLSNARGSMPFYRLSRVPGHSTVAEDMVSMYRSAGELVEVSEIEVRTLADICAEFAPENIDFLKIDVEGHEGAVLAGGDWDRYRPAVVVIEATRPEEWEKALEEASYREVLFDSVNRFYLAEERMDLYDRLRSPANMVLDDYVPYVFHDQLTSAGENNKALLARISELENLLADIAQKRMDEINARNAERARRDDERRRLEEELAEHRRLLTAAHAGTYATRRRVADLVSELATTSSKRGRALAEAGQKLVCRTRAIFERR